MKFLITAGPTREPLDPVRFLSNRSTGQMGYALAEAACRAGHEVLLISGPTPLAPPDGPVFIQVTTAAEMFEAVHDHLEGIDCLVMCAAVADYRPASYSKQKIKKADDALVIQLERTRDILLSVAERKKDFRVVGFAAETENIETHAKEKLRRKNCDLIVANDVGQSDRGFAAKENEVTLFFADGKKETFPLQSKRELAVRLVQVFEKL